MNNLDLLFHYGSPVYVYQMEQIRDAYKALRSALPIQSHLYYSLKANPHPAIVNEVKQLGCKAEISSTGEMKVALAVGFLPEQCLYNGPGKTLQEITLALSNGITHFSVDSPTDLQKISQAAETTNTVAKVLLRVNADESVARLGLTMTGIPSKFGVDASWIMSAPEQFVSTPWAKVVGFHLYMGTNIVSETALLQMFEVAISVSAQLQALLGLDAEIIDLGGGFGHPFAIAGERPDFSSLKSPLESLLDKKLPNWRIGKPQIVFETGRYLVAGSGALMTTVQDVKTSKGHHFVILDSGINHLGGMSGLRRVPRITPDIMKVREDEKETSMLMRDVNVVGPLCTPLDSWANGIDIPSLVPGDVVVIPNVGAYGLTGSLIGFLSYECPVEIILSDGKVQEASQLILNRCPKY